MRHLIFILLGLSLIGVGNFAFAQKKRKKKVFVVDFQDEFVEGHVKDPTIFHLFNKNQLEHDELVDLKKDFLPELRRTAGELD